jgi:hypothetical protein
MQKQVVYIYIKLLRRVSVLIHNLQGVYSCFTKVMNHSMTKYDVVMCCCYDKILVNVAAYVISGFVCVCVCVCVWCGVNSLKMVY